MSTRRFLLLLLAAQTACVAVGLGFHHLYLSATLKMAEDDAARATLAEQFESLRGDLDGRSLLALRKQPQSWNKLLQNWRATATPGGKLYLLDHDGRVLARAGDDSDFVAEQPAAPLVLKRPTAAWGEFTKPIHGALADGQGDEQVAVARPFGSHDGYLMLTRRADAEKVSPAVLTGAMWAAGAITMLWTAVLMGAVLFMLVSQTRKQRSRERIRPEVQALKRAQSLLRTQETVIFGLAQLADSRDRETGGHLRRIAAYSSALATALRKRPEFRDQITTDFLQLIGISSSLHDIGKVGIEDAILRKLGSLTIDERLRMQCHTEIGDACLKEIERRLGSTNFLQMAREIASAHHEKWDGSGYPNGLSGEEIPLSARIVALADVYDALVCRRVYKEALPHDQCVNVLAESSGSHFDPRMVETFLEIEDQFRRISSQIHDPSPPVDAQPPAAPASEKLLPPPLENDPSLTAWSGDVPTGG